ncbi:MAG: hypothetical protein OXH16_13135 [Gemmatimonadetes bacterium]|nr:hypothetical protein [Gemmatimonadota bacterium]
MTDTTWPDEPYRRKTVFVLNQTDIDALRFEEDGPELLLNEETHILPYPPQQSNPIVQDLIDSGIARPGTVLIQSPFDKDIYQNSTQAVELFALDKHFYFSRLCRYLGAREVTIKQIKCKNIEEETTVSLEGSVPMRGSVDGKIKNKELASLREKLVLKDKLPGGAPDVPAARELLRKTGLLGDANMRSLFDMRQGSNNQLASRELQLNVTTETRSNLNVLANLTVPPYLSLEAGYDRHVHEQTEFTLTIKVDF